MALLTLYVAEIDVVSDQSDEDLLGLYGHSEVRTPRAIRFWGELVGSEAKMEARELEGYEEAIEKILDALPPELRLAGLPPEMRMAGLPPEQRVAGMSAEQLLPGLPEEILRALSADYVAHLPAETAAAIRKRLGQA